ncbi:MAG: hypothetical protein V1816_09605 [Pseudomonadota bacterium]
MSLTPKFKAARKVLNGLSPSERAALEIICAEIRAAEEKLLEAGRVVCENGLCGAKGLCCRNVNLDEIINLQDFVFILVSDPSLGEAISGRLVNEGLFVANCLFLENGAGPCIFPRASRPETCITAFCGDDRPVRGELVEVRVGFERLSRFLAKRRLLRFGSALGRAWGRSW